MEQQDLIHEDWRDALRHAVKAMGGYDVVGAEIWPSKPRRAAGAWLSDCLNPERPAKLDIEEIQQLMRMARNKGLHIVLHFLCDELGYSRPSPVEPADQEADVNRQLDASLEKLNQLTNRLARIRGTATQ